MIPSRLRERKDLPGLNVILGVSKETIERNVLQPMREIYTGGVVGTINNRNIAMVCGVPVYCLGASKANQVAMLQGMSIKYCYGDEIAKWSQPVFEMLKSRLDKPYSCFDGACNPESPKHWLKEFIDEPDLNMYVQKYTIFDNPYLTKEYIEDLCKEYEGTVYYPRLILGEWTLAEGLIYPMWQKALISADEIDISRAEEISISIDYGTLNAFAAVLWAKIKNVWYAFRCYYYSGRDTGTLKTDEDYKNDLMEWCADIHEMVSKKRIKTIYGMSEGEKIEVIVDPSAASFITALKKTGWFSVRHAVNDVLDGIRDTAVGMQMGYIKISDDIEPFRDEVQGYVWDLDTEMPVKIADHIMDSIRYQVMTKKIVKYRQAG